MPDYFGLFTDLFIALASISLVGKKTLECTEWNGMWWLGAGARTIWGKLCTIVDSNAHLNTMSWPFFQKYFFFQSSPVREGMWRRIPRPPAACKNPTRICAQFGWSQHASSCPCRTWKGVTWSQELVYRRIPVKPTWPRPWWRCCCSLWPLTWRQSPWGRPWSGWKKKTKDMNSWMDSLVQLQFPKLTAHRLVSLITVSTVQLDESSSRRVYKIT